MDHWKGLMLPIRKPTIKTSSTNRDDSWPGQVNRGEGGGLCGTTGTQYTDHAFGSSNTRSIHLLLKGFLWKRAFMENASIIKADRQMSFTRCYLFYYQSKYSQTIPYKHTWNTRSLTPARTLHVHIFIPTSAYFSIDCKVYRHFKNWPIFRLGLCDMKDIHSYSIFSEGTEKQVVWYPDTKISEHRKISHIARSLKEPSVGSPRPRESTAGL